MFDKLKMKVAARRVKATKKTRTKKTKQQKTLGKRIWNVISWPFRMIAKLLKWFWKWVCGLNMVGVVNLALLVAIIVLFSMLILDIVGCKKQQIVVVAEPVPVTEQVVVSDEMAPRSLTRRKVVLPIKTNPLTYKKEVPAINVVPVNEQEVKIAEKQTATKNNKFWGDVIIDSRAAASMLQNGAQVHGNLYLQDMRKFTLPCNIHIDGNLFLRDVNMLQFCGDFVITGNIYVSPRSSFGPIPKTAHLGGHVIL